MQIYCFGDSNTYGYDPRDYFGGRYAAQDRWVDLLASMTGHTLINAGANGRTIPRSVQFPNADLHIIFLGTNDLLQGASAKETADRMETFLNTLQPQRKQLLLIAPPTMKRGAWVPTEELVVESIRLAEEYGRVARMLNVPFVDTRHWSVDLCFDGVHFTEAGHHTFAENLRKELEL